MDPACPTGGDSSRPGPEVTHQEENGSKGLPLRARSVQASLLPPSLEHICVPSSQAQHHLQTLLACRGLGVGMS